MSKLHTKVSFDICLFEYLIEVNLALLCYCFLSQIWGMVNWAQVKLQDGHVSMALRDGDFHFSYFLWFEDNSVSISFYSHDDSLQPKITVTTAAAGTIT